MASNKEKLKKRKSDKSKEWTIYLLNGNGALLLKRRKIFGELLGLFFLRKLLIQNKTLAEYKENKNNRTCQGFLHYTILHYA